MLLNFRAQFFLEHRLDFACQAVPASFTRSRHSPVGGWEPCPPSPRARVEESAWLEEKSPAASAARSNCGRRWMPR